MFEEAGFVPTGQSPDGSLVEIVELPTSEHPVVPGRPVPPRVQVEADQGPPPVPGIHRRRPRLRRPRRGEPLRDPSPGRQSAVSARRSFEGDRTARDRPVDRTRGRDFTISGSRPRCNWGISEGPPQDRWTLQEPSSRSPTACPSRSARPGSPDRRLAAVLEADPWPVMVIGRRMKVPAPSRRLPGEHPRIGDARPGLGRVRGGSRRPRANGLVTHHSRPAARHDRFIGRRAVSGG